MKTIPSSDPHMTSLVSLFLNAHVVVGLHMIWLYNDTFSPANIVWLTLSPFFNYNSCIPSFTSSYSSMMSCCSGGEKNIAQVLFYFNQ